MFSPRTPSPRTARRPAQLRRGFTLIELMIVVVIIAALIALLVPAVSGVWRNARDAQVKSEISQIEAAIAQFKAVYGVEPPSRLVICEDQSKWGDDESGTNVRWSVAEKRRSQAYIRRIWPQFNFDPANTLEVTGDGKTGTYDLTAGECMAFFLGGPRYYDLATQKFEATGFNKNPALPFSPGGNREGPFLQFDPARFVDLDKDGFPEYLDSYPGQKNPLLYFSSYEGKGYEFLDWASTPLDSDLAAEVPNPYADDDGPYHRPPAIVAASTSAPKWFNPQSFQIVSPGADGEYGNKTTLIGGLFDPENPNNSMTNDRQSEWDNLTNFHPGRLRP